MIPRARASAALDTATVMPRSLNDPVGFVASYLTSRRNPCGFPRRDSSSGVPPSRRVMTGVASVKGRNSRYSSMTPRHMRGCISIPSILLKRVLPTGYGLLRAGSWPMGLGRRRLPEYDEAAPGQDAGGESRMQLPEKVKKFLEKPNFAVLATVRPKGRPQATPVWFLLDGEEILMDTSQGRVKLRNLEANPYAAIAVVDKDNPYLYVQIRRQARLDFANRARDIHRLSMRYGGQPYKYPPTDSPQKRVSLRMRPTGFSGMGMG